MVRTAVTRCAYGQGAAGPRARFERVWGRGGRCASSVSAAKTVCPLRVSEQRPARGAAARARASELPVAEHGNHIEAAALRSRDTGTARGWHGIRGGGGQARASSGSRNND